MNFKDLTSQNGETKGYFQVPNYLFDLKIPSGEKLVLINLIRRANRKNARSCFPSLETIGSDCSMCRETVSKLILKLHERGLIEAKKVGRLYHYEIPQAIYDAIDKANQTYKNKKKDGELDSEDKKIERICEKTSHFEDGNGKDIEKASLIGENLPHEYAKILRTNVDVLSKTTNENYKTKTPPINPPLTAKPTAGLVQEENILGAKMKSKDSARERPNTFAEADRYFKTRNEEEKAAFDVSAAKLSPYVTSPVIRRRRYFQELLEVHTVRREGESTFTIPAEIQLASEPQEAIH